MRPQAPLRPLFAHFPALSPPRPQRHRMAGMRELAPDLHMLKGFPPNAINVYVMGDVLVDAATRHARRRIMRQLAGRRVTTHALTHCHPDHQGASHELCERLGLPAVVRGGRRGRNGERRLRTAGPSGQPAHHAGLGRPAAPGREAPARGRRGGRLSGPGGAGALARARGLLARVRPRARDGGRGQQHERPHRASGPARADRRSSRPTRCEIASRSGGWRRSSRRWPASATARRCATRGGCTSFAAGLPE